MGEGEVLTVVKWDPATCGKEKSCVSHMGDDQWDDIESMAEAAYDSNNKSSSDDDS